MKQFTATIMLATLGAQAARVLKQAKPYISGEIRTKESFQYGRFKTKIQGSDRKGTLASIKTLFIGDENEDLSAKNWNHINLEIKPHQHKKVTTNLIWAGFTNWWENVKDFNPADDWHTYEITWTPDYVAFSIDDVERRREEHTSEGENEAVNDLDKQ